MLKPSSPSLWPLLWFVCVFILMTKYFPIPQAVDQEGWNAFIVFSLTISLVIFKVYDMGVVSFLALSTLILSSTLTLDKSLEKFSYPITWLVVIAFFISKAFILSGLGKRIALLMSVKIGTTPLRLSYALMGAELIIAPFIPSNTARGGGLIVPVAQALGESIFGEPTEERKNYRHWNAYLLYCCFQANLISSALFFTAMAGNPIIANIASEVGFEINWIDWFLAAVLPSAIALLLTPLILKMLIKPDSAIIDNLRGETQKAYQSLGEVSYKEKVMACVFILLLIGWIFGPALGIHATSAALFAITILLLANVLSWKDLVTDEHAWTTFIWLTVLFTLTGLMKDHGFITWVAEGLTQSLPAMNPKLLLGFLMLVNFYSHYFFASLTSHITTIFHPIVLIGMQMGVPLKPLIFGLAFSTSLSGGLTHYGTGSGTITYSSGYWTLKNWWWLGFIQSSISLFIFILIGFPVWF